MRFAALLILLYAIAAGITDAFRLPVLGKKFQPAEIIFIVLAIATIIKVIQGHLRIQKLNQIDFAVLFYLFIEIISATYWNERSRWLEVAATGYLTALYFILKTFFSNNHVTPKQINLTVVIAGGLAALLGIIGWTLAQFHIHTDLAWPVNADYPYFRHVGRATGLMTGPNMLFNFLGICFLWFLSAKWFSEKKSSARNWLMLLITIAMLLTFSKNILLLAIAVILLWNIYQLQKKWVRHLSILVSTTILILYILGTHFVIVNTNSTLWKNRTEHSYFIDKIMWQSEDLVIVPTSYFVLRETALNAGLDYPVIGLGPGAHHIYIAALKKQEKYPAHFENYDPHSIYLGSFATLGFIGLLAIIGLTLITWNKLSPIKSLHENKPLVPFLKASMLFMFLDSINMDTLHFRHLWIIMALVSFVVYLQQRKLNADGVTSRITS